MAQKDSSFTQRAIMVLVEEQAKLAEAQWNIRTTIAALAKEHGIRMPTDSRGS